VSASVGFDGEFERVVLQIFSEVSSIVILQRWDKETADKRSHLSKVLAAVISKISDKLEL